MTPPDAIKRQGVVLRSEGSVAYIQLFPLAGCVGCERMQRLGFGPGHCGIDLLGLTNSAQNPTIEIPIHTANGIVLEADDTVEVRIKAPNAAWVALACRVYGLPTLGLMLGATIGSLIGEPVALGLAVLGLSAGLWFGRRSACVPQSMSELLGPAQPSLRIVNVAVEEM